jgi:hypothetical protein
MKPQAFRPADYQEIEGTSFKGPLQEKIRMKAINYLR